MSHSSQPSGHEKTPESPLSSEERKNEYNIVIR
jgi:hypothetical protein